MFRRILKSFRGCRPASPSRENRLFERLEDRVLFNAAPGADMLPAPEAVEMQAEDILIVHDAHTNPAEQLPSELLVIDAAVADREALLAEFDLDGRDIQIVELNSAEDGVAQIAALLNEQSEIDALHVVAHGNDHQLQLGSTNLSLENLGEYSAAISGWASSLSDHADLLLYGCNLASGSDGLELMSALQDLTGADVAASTDITGHSSLNGDWILETNLGDVETAELGFAAASAWQNTLAAPVATDDTPTTAEDTAVSGNVITVDYGTGADSDADGDSLSVSLVNGLTITDGATITLSSGALLTMFENGDFTYDPNNQFNDLENDDTATDSFTYRLEDSTGATDDATVNVTITAVTLIDLELEKTISNPDATFGDQVTWTIAVTNNEDNATGNATGVIVADVIPSGQHVLPGTAVIPGSGSFNESTGVWTVGDPIAPGETVVLTFDTILETTTVSPDTIDLELDITSSSTGGATGTPIDFVVTLTNDAESATVAAEGIRVDGLNSTNLNLLPPSSVASHGAFNSTTGIWEFGTDILAPGETATLSFQATLGGASAELNPEVLAAIGTDFDSTPNNGSTSEDDDDSVQIELELDPASRIVSGVVFNDLNNDGVQNGSEIGVSNVTITAYDSDNNVLDIATSISDGSYLFALPDDDVRLEFSNLPTNWTGSTASVGDEDAVSSIAFLSATGNTTANLAIYSPADTAEFAVTCVVYPGADGTEGGDDAAIVVHSADGTVKEVIATIDEVGTTNGLAQSKVTDDLFVASFQKRHTDLGPDGNSAVYRVDDAGNVSTFIKLDDFFGADSAGVYSHDATDFFHDAPAISEVGKVSLGDIDISDTNDFVYVMNLADRSIYQIQIGENSDPTTAIDYTAGDSRLIQRFEILGNDLTNPTNGGIALEQLGLEPDANIRPFALKYHDGLLYVGMVNSAQYDAAGLEGNSSPDDLHAYVYTLDPETGEFSEAPVVDFALDYERETKHTVAGSANWDPWVDDMANFTFAPDINRVVETTQPWLTDIEFDSDGNILLGLRDRTADQFGQKAPGPFDDATNIVVFSAGDILRAEPIDATSWAIEESVAHGNDAESEYFNGEEFADHFETAQGGLAYADGLNSVFTTAMDPENANSGGVIGLDIADGSQTYAVELYESLFALDRTFGKLNGLGDLEYTNNLEIEVGNRIWLDANEDGVQDAGEDGIGDVTLHLFDVSDPSSPVLVGTTQTDGDGEYYFNETNVTYSDQGDVNGLRALTDYVIRIDAAEFDAGGQLWSRNITTANNEQTVLSNAITSVNGAAELDLDGDGTTETARIDRVDVLANNNLYRDGTRIVIRSASGGTATVDENNTVIFEYDEGFTSGSFVYDVVSDLLDSDATGVDTTGDNLDDEAFITFTSGHAGKTDHSLDFGLIEEPIDLELEVLVDRQTAEAGDLLRYSVEVFNNSANATGVASGIVVSDLNLPANVSFIADSETMTQAGSFDATAGEWTIDGPVAAGETVTLTFDVMVDSGNAGEVFALGGQIQSAFGNDVDSTVNNDDGDHSEDDEDDAVFMMSVGEGAEVVNIVQVIAANERDVDSTPNNDDNDQSEDDETAITVIARDNTPPVAEGTAIIMQEGSEGNPLDIPAPTDFDDDTLTAIITELPRLGTITLDDGTPVLIGDELTVAQLTSLLYDVPPDYDESDPGDLLFDVTDSKETVSASVDIAITLPTARDNHYVTDQSTPAIGDIVIDDTGDGVDSDPEDDVLSVIAINGVTLTPGEPVELPSGAQVTVLSDGTMQWDPNGAYDSLAEGEIGTDTFDYTIADGNGGTDTATVTIEINGINDPPTAPPTEVVVQEGSTDNPLGIDVPDDPEGDPLTAEITELPNRGTVTLPDGTPVIVGTTLTVPELESLVYDAPDDDDGTDPGDLTYDLSDGEHTIPGSVDITITRPTALDNDYITQESTPVTADMIVDETGSGIDSDPENDTLTVTRINGDAITPGGTITLPSGAELTVNSDGTFVWDPRDQYAYLSINESALDSFDYEITDGNGGTDTATVTITINGEQTADEFYPDYVVTKVADVDTVSAGDQIVYTIVIGNQGTVDGQDVVVSDTFPVDLLTDVVASDSGVINTASGTITWNFDQLAVNEQRTLTVTATVANTVAENIELVNNAVVITDDGSEGPDPTPENNSATELTPLDATPDYRITKTDDVFNVTSGDTLEYVILVENIGTQAGTGLIITDTYPSDAITLVSVNGGTIDATNDTITWTADRLAAGDSIELRFTARVQDELESGSNSFTNTVTVTDDGINGPDPTPENNTDTDTDTVLSGPDYQLTKDDGLSIVHPGDTVTYTIRVRNAGEQGGTGVVIEDTYDPAMLENVVASDGGVANTANNTVTWNIGSLAAGEEVIVTLTGQVTDEIAAGIEQFENSAVVYDDGRNGDDPSPDDNFDNDIDLIDESVRPDYQLRKSNGVTAVSIGDRVTYSIVVTNTGDQAGSGVVVQDTFAPGTLADLVASDGGIVNEAAGTVEWNLGTLGIGETRTLTLEATVASSFTAGTDYVTNYAEVTDDGSSGPDPTPEDNRDDDTDLLNAQPDYRITKTNHRDTVNAGDVLTYEIVVENIGNQTGTNVAITDTFDTTLLEILSASGGAVNSNAGTITWTLPSLDAGDTFTVTVEAQVAATIPAGQTTLLNSVEVNDDGSDGDDPTPDNNYADDEDLIDATPDLTVVKELSFDDAGNLVYTIRYSNVGDMAAVGVVVTEAPPVDAEFDALLSSAGWTANDDGTFTFDVGTLTAGNSGELVFVLNGDELDAAAIRNEVEIADDGSVGPDPTPENNISIVITPTQAPAEFAFDSITDPGENGLDLPDYNPPTGSPVWPWTGISREHRLTPVPVDTVFTGIVDPGTTLTGRIFDRDGRIIGEQTVVAGTAGNWLLSFPTTVIYEHPHSMRIDQTLALQNDQAFAGFNMRRYFHPAVHTQLYVNQLPSVNGALREAASTWLHANHVANSNVVPVPWTRFAQELTTASTNIAAH